MIAGGLSKGHNILNICQDYHLCHYIIVSQEQYAVLLHMYERRISFLQRVLRQMKYCSGEDNLRQVRLIVLTKGELKYADNHQM